MNTPHLATPLEVDTLWHTNWGFAVKQIIRGISYNYFLDSRIPGNHREYAGNHIIPGQRKEHVNVSNQGGTESPLLPQTFAFLRARISSTLDDIPLDPILAIDTVKMLWGKRIDAAKTADKPPLIAQERNICLALETVIDGQAPTILALDGIFGICVGLKQAEGDFTLQ